MAKLYYYNQNSYDYVSYNKPNGEEATIKSGGCGVCSACIVLNTLAQKELLSVAEMAKFSIEHKARINDGTDEKTLLTALCKQFKGFSFKVSNDIKELKKHLKSGGMAICNQGKAYNVFSTRGHYVVAYRLIDSNIDIVDPQMYSGKYDKKPRPERIIKKTAYGCIVKPSQLKKATADRNPSYYLVSYEKPTNKPSVIAGQTVTLTNANVIYKSASKDKPFTVGELSQFKCDLKAQYKKGTKIKALAVDYVKGNMWLKTELGYVIAYDKKKDKAYIK